MKNLNEIENYMKSGEFESAITVLNSALKTEPENVQVIFLLGVCYFRQGKMADAESTFRKAIAIDTNSEKVWYYLGLVLEKQGKLDDAQITFKMATTINPNFTAALNKLDSNTVTGPRLNNFQRSSTHDQNTDSAEEIGRLEEKAREAELAKGVYTQVKSRTTYTTQKVGTVLMHLVFGGSLFCGIGGFIGYGVFQVPGAIMGIAAGCVIAIMAAIIGAGNVSHRV